MEERKAMPTYEYVCEACAHRFERFQNISAQPIRGCPECGKRRVKRLISVGGGFVFKGPGFYATDYRKGSPLAEGKKKGTKKGEGGDGPRGKSGADQKGSGDKSRSDD